MIERCIWCDVLDACNPQGSGANLAHSCVDSRRCAYRMEITLRYHEPDALEFWTTVW